MARVTIHKSPPVVDLFLLDFASDKIIYRRAIKRTDVMDRTAVAAADESPAIHSCADGGVILRCR